MSADDAPRPCFERQRLIRFSDCDPAGIVFYPQYFVMFNGLLEDWFTEGLGMAFSSLIAERRIGVPTVHLEADFRAISRFGDVVSLRLGVQALGQRSIRLRSSCHGADGALRVEMRQVLVTTTLESHAAVAIPDDIRAAIVRSAGLS